MSAIFFEYVDASATEKKYMVENAEIDLKLDKLFSAFEMVEMNLALNYEAAELKVMKESGTYDDLNALYEEANAEADSKKKGILSSIINGIINVCKSIRNTTAGLFKKGETDEDVQAPNGYEKDASAIKGCWNRIRGGFQKVKSGDLKGIGDIISGAAIPTLVTVGVAGGAAITYKTVKKSQLKKTSDEIEKISNEMENDLKSVQGVVNAAGAVANAVSGGTDNEKISKFKEFLNCISNFIKKCREFITGLFKKGGDSTDASTSANSDKVGNNRPSRPGASDKKDAGAIRKNINEIKKAMSKETDKDKKAEYQQRLTVLNNNLASLISKNPDLVSRKEKKNSAKADAVKKTISNLQAELGKAKTADERAKLQDKIKNAQDLLSKYTKECGLELEITMSENFSFVEFFESARRLELKNIEEPVFEFGDLFDDFEDCFYESEESFISNDEISEELDEIQRLLEEE